jgi:hypothetical protein
LFFVVALSAVLQLGCMGPSHKAFTGQTADLLDHFNCQWNQTFGLENIDIGALGLEAGKAWQYFSTYCQSSGE